MGMIDKLKGVLQAAPSPVSGFFKPLAKNNPVLATRLTEFVTAGKHPTILMNLSAADQQAVNSNISPWSGSQAMKPLLETPNRLAPPQWLRLGQVLALSTPRTAPAPAGVPEWFWALQYFRQRADDKNLCWDPAWAVQLLAAGDVETARVPSVILAAFFALLGDGVRAWRDHPQTAPAQQMVALILQYNETVPKLMAQVGAADRVRFADWLGIYPNLIPPLMPMLGEWAICPQKTVREAAVTRIAQVEGWSTLAAAVDQGGVANLDTVINHLGRQGPTGQQVLQWALEQNRGGKRDELLTAALKLSQATAGQPDVGIDIPPKPPLDTTPLGPQFTAALQAALDRQVENLRASAAANPKNNWAKNQLAIAANRGPMFAERMRAFLNGQGRMPDNRDYIPVSIWQGLNLPMLAQVRLNVTRRDNDVTLQAWAVQRLLQTGNDLRTVADAAAVAGVRDPVANISDAVYSYWYSPANMGNVWPFFAEHPQRVDEALGLIPRANPPKYLDGPREIKRSLDILQAVPSLPQRYVPVLAQMATGEAKSFRRQAQELLERQPGAVTIALQTLTNSKSDVRAVGAAWLARIGDATAVPPLRAALAREKRENAQAAMLNALHQLGDDISGDLAPDKLEAAAEKGLSAARSAGLAWFPMDALPTCYWNDGGLVDARIITWWAVLAAKLKDPLGAGLIPIYVGLLDEPSRQALGSFVLEAWIAYDTRRASDDDTRSYAEANLSSRLTQYKRWGREWAQMTPDQVFDQLRKEKANEYLGSAVADKGLLALTVGAPGHQVFAAVTRYIRDHGQRRAQVEALITAASANPDPAAIQLVLSIARKHKQETVRLKAVELTEAIAERAGWTIDELADRTVPTAGFEDDGLLRLDLGPRTFTGRIGRTKTGAFTIVLYNQDDRPVAALPKADSDDAEMAAAARKQLTAAKKEVTQVVALQSARLFEAMCVGRTWDPAVWQEFLLGHPVMKHLVSTLVWRSGDTLFRPTVDDELLDIDDEGIELGVANVSLAHRALVDAQTAKQWIEHLRDYNVGPLFDQFKAVTPAVSPLATKINDHEGWLSDSFAIRGRATKRGYARGSSEDGGWFSEYFKKLPESGLRVVISFTGSILPEELVPAAVEELSFEKDGAALALKDVPPILLAESYADYVNIAEAGVFDPKWRDKAGF